MSNFLRPNTGVTITVAASDKLATWSLGDYLVTKTVGYPNLPDTQATVYEGSGSNTTSAFSLATEVTIQAGDYGLYYQTGTGPVIPEIKNLESSQTATPGALNSTGTLTAALILGGIVTSTTGAGVTATLDTGTVMDAAIDMAIGDAFEWSVINTGGNTFTVTASTAHTLVGSGAVATVTSGRFLTRRSAAGTWITYRLA